MRVGGATCLQRQPDQLPAPGRGQALAVLAAQVVGAGLVGSFAWSLVITVIAAVTGFFILRRATPRAA